MIAEGMRSTELAGKGIVLRSMWAMLVCRWNEAQSEKLKLIMGVLAHAGQAQLGICFARFRIDGSKLAKL